MPSNNSNSNSNSNNNNSNSNSRSPGFGRRLGTGAKESSSSNSNSNNSGARGLMNNLSNSSPSHSKTELAWFTNIIPIFIICSFALAFRIMAKQYTFCNISNNVCGNPLITIEKSTSSNNENNGDGDGDGDGDSAAPRVNISCPENKNAEPKPPVTNPAFATGLLWVLFIMSAILCAWIAMSGGGWVPIILTACLAITFLGLAIDASVNGDAGRSVTAIMVMIIMTAIVVAVINVVADQGSRNIAIAASVVAFTLIGILADNHRLIQEGHIGYALTRSITMLLFVLNVVYIMLLMVILGVASINLGVGKMLATEYVALLLLICMIAQVAVYANFLNKCLKKKYECMPSLRISPDGVSSIGEDSDAGRMAEFVARCSANGIEKLNVRGATIAISVLAVVVFLLSTPRTLKAIIEITGWAGKTSAGALILACIVLLVLSFVN